MRCTPLVALKAAHTVIYAFMAGCTFAIPIASCRGKHRAATIFSAIVGIEVAVLLLNKGVCPISPLAARYTDDRRANFDIYLPAWLAGQTPLIFGGLYVCFVGYALERRLRTPFRSGSRSLDRRPESPALHSAGWRDRR